jgi:hypothetical protein
LTEFDFRYSKHQIKDGERTVKAITQAAGKRLVYRETIAQDRVLPWLFRICGDNHGTMRVRPHNVPTIRVEGDNVWCRAQRRIP